MLPSGILICCTGPFWSGFLCLFGFCLLSLRCLISALTQAGRVISYLGSLVQFSPAAGRAGRCRQILQCVDSTHRAPATLGLPRTRVSVLSPSTLLRFPAALYGAGPALSAVPVFGYSTKARIRLHLCFVPSPAWAAQVARGLCALSLDAARLFLPRRAAQSARGLRTLSPGAARLFPPRPQGVPPVGCLRLGLFSGAGL